MFTTLVEKLPIGYWILCGPKTSYRQCHNTLPPELVELSTNANFSPRQEPFVK